MPLYDVRCPRCGKEAERWAKVDERHIPCDDGLCGYATERIWKANKNSRAEEVTWPGGRTYENGFDQPTTFYSPKDFRAALAANGYKVRDDHERKIAPLSAHGLKEAEAMIARMYPDAGRA